MRVVDRNQLKRPSELYWWRLLVIAFGTVLLIHIAVRLFVIDYVNHPAVSIAITLVGASVGVMATYLTQSWWRRAYRTARHARAERR